jgi:prefoldin subunit 5
LAAGKPVVVQDTGFSSIIPVGEGILIFKTLEEATDAIREAETNYNQHAKAARAIAEEYFDSDKILTRLVEEAMNNND